MDEYQRWSADNKELIAKKGSDSKIPKKKRRILEFLDKRKYDIDTKLTKMFFGAGFSTLQD